jgi:hypothetical protein
MNEEELNSFLGSRPFGTAEAMQADAQFRRCSKLGAALWGKTPDALQRQLLAPYPEIPSGFDLADFRELQRSIQAISVASGDPKFAWLPRSALSALFNSEIFVGTQRFTALEARCEIVRRAIEYLEGR